MPTAPQCRSPATAGDARNHAAECGGSAPAPGRMPCPQDAPPGRPCGAEGSRAGAARRCAALPSVTIDPEAVPAMTSTLAVPPLVDLQPPESSRGTGVAGDRTGRLWAPLPPRIPDRLTARSTARIDPHRPESRTHPSVLTIANPHVSRRLNGFCGYGMVNLDGLVNDG